MGYLIKLNRISAWFLLALMFVYFLTGFDMLKNFWRPDFSRYLHNQILPLPAIFVILFHAGVGLKVFLIRNKLDNKFLNAIFILAGILVFLLAVYLLYR